jgi:integrase
MTWIAAENRWIKKYKGNWYKVSAKKLGCKPAERASQEAANKWWETKQAKIDALEEAHPAPGLYETRRRKMADWFRHIGDNDAAEEVLVAEMPIAKGDPFRNVSPEGATVWQDRFDTLDDLTLAKNQDRTIKTWVNKWLARQRTRVAAQEISSDRYESYRHALNSFGNWLGDAKGVECVTTTALDDYHQHLLTLIAKRKENEKDGIASSYGKMKIDVAKQFARFLVRYADIAMPKNLLAKGELAIKVNLTTPIILQPSQVRSLFQALDASNAVYKDRMRLWLLLMLNCGMYQGDVAKLRHDEVDWQRGRIVRKRSKTANSPDVPTVTYKLWRSTFDLLQCHRSNHRVLVLLNEDGQPLSKKYIGDDHKGKKTCNITKAYSSLKFPVSLGKLRKSSSNLLFNKKEFKVLHTLFLGHSPRSISERFYVTPDDDTLDEAIDWLEVQYAL